ncbi:MAG: MFS transporter [Acidobacteriota bacterium]|nr:MFS transporter [Acidobacteriota bacterium]
MASAVKLKLAPPIAQAGFLGLILFSLGHFFIDLYSAALGTFQPVLGDRLGLSLTQAGILGGMMGLSSSVMQPVWGFLSDRFHTRLFSALAPAVAGIFISALGIAPSFGWLIFLVVLGGMGIASFHPQASARATLGLAGNRGRWMAIFISAGTLGLAFGPTYFSTWLTLAGPLRTCWAAIPGVLITVLLLVMLPVHDPPAGPRQRYEWRPLAAVWKPLTVLYFLVFIRSVVQVVFSQFLPLYLHRERGFTIADASYSLSLYLAFGAVGGFLGGHMADRFGGRKVIMISMIGCLPFLALFFLTGGALSILGLALTGLVLLFTIPVNVVMAQELVPSQSGTVSALMMGFAWGMAGLIFIPLTGWLGDQITLGRALAAVAMFPAAGFLLSLKLPK